MMECHMGAMLPEQRRTQMAQSCPRRSTPAPFRRLQPALFCLFLFFFYIPSHTSYFSALGVIATTSTTSFTLPTLNTTDALGFPLFYISSTPFTTASTLNVSLPYVPVNFGPSIPSITAIAGVLGLSGGVLQPFEPPSTAPPSNRDGCGTWQAPAGYAVTPTPGSIKPLWYQQKIVLLQRGGNCSDHSKVVKAQQAGASMVLLVGCTATLPGGSSGQCSWGPLLDSDDATPERKVTIPTLQISQASGDVIRTKMALSTSSTPLYLFAPGGGMVQEDQEWGALQSLAAAISFPSLVDPAGSGTRSLSDLVPSPPGATTPNLNAGLDPCYLRVRGVWCVDGRVIALSVAGLGQIRRSITSSSNSLPVELLQLSHLSVLSLPRNNLAGAIPSGLWTSMPRLVHVDLSGQSLSNGLSVPASSSSLNLNHTGIHHLNLSSNSFTGSLDETLMSTLAPTLKVLDVSRNAFTGVLPAGLGGLINLWELRLDQNKWTGALDGQIFSGMTELRVLSASANKFSGALPSALSSLRHLTSINLAHNLFTGVIPAEWFELAELREVVLSDNQLQGAIPADISAWASTLTRLHLDHNEFTGAVPIEIGALTSLTSLDLSRNALTSLPIAALRALSRLEVLHVGFNELEGVWFSIEEDPMEVVESIDPSMHWPSLRSLHLEHNKLSGLMPKLSGMVKLEEVVLDHNAFGGTLMDPPEEPAYEMAPSQFNHLPQLRTFSAAHNHLVATLFLPDFLNCPLMTLMDLTNNTWLVIEEGPNPRWNLPSLQVLRLGRNALKWGTSSLASTLASTTPSLVELDLSHNQVMGSLDLGLMVSRLPSTLKRLFMAHNDIEASFSVAQGTSLGGLTHLDLSYNRLTSLSPTLLSSGALPNLMLLDLSHTGLSGESLLALEPLLAPMASIKMEGNPALTFADNKLPAWIRVADTRVKANPNDRYSCPQLFSQNRGLLINLPPSSYGYTLCQCDLGTYGLPPLCMSLPTLVDLTSSSAPTSHPLLVAPQYPEGQLDSHGLQLVSSLSDDVFGSTRHTPGVDVSWVLGGPWSNSSSTTNSSWEGAAPIRAVFIDLRLDTKEFNGPAERINVYAGEGAVKEGSTPPLYSFHGSDYSESTAEYVSVRLSIPSSRATLSFRSSSYAGSHFTANWSTSSSCPSGYTLVDEEWVEQITERDAEGNMTVRHIGVYEEGQDGMCLPVHQPNVRMQQAVYAFTAVMLVANVACFITLLVQRTRLVAHVKELSLPLSPYLLLQFVCWNLLLSLSGALFALDPSPYASGWGGIPAFFNRHECELRPWPVAMGGTALMALLLSTAAALRPKRPVVPVPVSVDPAVNKDPTKKPAPVNGPNSVLAALLLVGLQLSMLLVYSVLPLSTLRLVRGSSDLAPASPLGSYVFECSSYQSSGPYHEAWYFAWLGVEAILFLGLGAAVVWCLFQARPKPSTPFFQAQAVIRLAVTLVGLVLLLLVCLGLSSVWHWSPSHLLLVRGVGINLASLLVLRGWVVPTMRSMLATQPPSTKAAASGVPIKAHRRKVSFNKEFLPSETHFEPVMKLGGSGSGGGYDDYSRPSSVCASPSSSRSMVPHLRPAIGRFETYSEPQQGLSDPFVPSHVSSPPRPSPPPLRMHSRSGSLSRTNPLVLSPHKKQEQTAASLSASSPAGPAFASALRTPRTPPAPPSYSKALVSLPPDQAASLSTLLADLEASYRSNNEARLADNFKRWKDSYDAERSMHLEHVLHAHQERMSALKKRLERDMSYMRKVDAWFAGLQAAIPPDRPESQKQHDMFQALRPEADLLKEHTVAEEEDMPPSTPKFTSELPLPQLSLMSAMTAASPVKPPAAAGKLSFEPSTPNFTSSSSSRAGSTQHTPKQASSLNIQNNSPAALHSWPESTPGGSLVMPAAGEASLSRSELATSQSTTASPGRPPRKTLRPSSGSFSSHLSAVSQPSSGSSSSSGSPVPGHLKKHEVFHHQRSLRTSANNTPTHSGFISPSGSGSGAGNDTWSPSRVNGGSGLPPMSPLPPSASKMSSNNDRSFTIDLRGNYPSPQANKGSILNSSPMRGRQQQQQQGAGTNESPSHRARPSPSSRRCKTLSFDARVSRRPSHSSSSSWGGSEGLGGDLLPFGLPRVDGSEEEEEEEQQQQPQQQKEEDKRQVGLSQSMPVSPNKHISSTYPPPSSPVSPASYSSTQPIPPSLASLAHDFKMNFNPLFSFNTGGLILHTPLRPPSPQQLQAKAEAERRAQALKEKIQGGEEEDKEAASVPPSNDDSDASEDASLRSSDSPLLQVQQPLPTLPVQVPQSSGLVQIPQPPQRPALGRSSMRKLLFDEPPEKGTDEKQPLKPQHKMIELAAFRPPPSPRVTPIQIPAAFSLPDLAAPLSPALPSFSVSEINVSLQAMEPTDNDSVEFAARTPTLLPMAAPLMFAAMRPPTEQTAATEPAVNTAALQPQSPLTVSGSALTPVEDEKSTSRTYTYATIAPAPAPLSPTDDSSASSSPHDDLTPTSSDLMTDASSTAGTDYSSARRHEDDEDDHSDHFSEIESQHAEGEEEEELDDGPSHLHVTSADLNPLEEIHLQLDQTIVPEA